LRKGFESISIPAISSGIFGFPKDKCAKILVNETISFLKTWRTHPQVLG
jgi:O-acetyl-ADP-ribose deacetylase (regulator of RNase III)